MKRTYSFINIAAALTNLLLIGCAEADSYGDKLAKESYLKVDKTSVSLSGNSSESVQVSASENLNWEAVNVPSWINLSTKSSRGSASITITPNEDNPSTTERQASVNLKSKVYDLTTSIQVTQAGTFLTSNTKSIEFPLDGGSESVSFDTNAKWTITGLPDWIACDTKSGNAGQNTLTFTTQKNTKDKVKSDKIVISAANKATSLSIDVTQTDLQLKVNKTSLTFTPKEGEEKVNVTANSVWTATSDKTWCIVTPASSSSNGTLTIKVLANTGKDERSAKITLTSGEVKRTIDVKQEAEPLLDTKEIGFSFGSTGGTAIINISSNVTWTITCNEKWVHLNESTNNSSTYNGKGDAIVKIYVDENKEAVDRNSVLTLKSGTITKSITIAQEGLFDVTSSLSFTADGSNQKITITAVSTREWRITRKNTDTWVHLNTSTNTSNTYDGKGGKSVTIYVDKNTGTSARSCELTVTSGKITKTVKVTQAVKPVEMDLKEMLERPLGTLYGAHFTLYSYSVVKNKVKEKYTINEDNSYFSLWANKNTNLQNLVYKGIPFYNLYVFNNNSTNKVDDVIYEFQIEKSKLSTSKSFSVLMEMKNDLEALGIKMSSKVNSRYSYNYEGSSKGVLYYLRLDESTTHYRYLIQMSL